MAKHKIQVTMVIKVAFWVHPYLTALSFFAILLQQEPDYEKAQRMVLKGISYKLYDSTTGLPLPTKSLWAKLRSRWKPQPRDREPTS